MRAFAKPDHERLFDLAESQAGYFTMAQAVEAGFGRSTHCYHVNANNWIREHRGIYRLKRFPVTESGQLVLWSLWSRDKKGIPQGVYSHATALQIRELSDVNPSKLHMTVPPDFRRNSLVPPVLVLHKASLSPSEIIWEHGYAVTTAMRAILDMAASGDSDRDVIEQAFREGRRRGLITRQQIDLVLPRKDLPRWLAQIFEA